jgi:hypoxanthine phosphoribosyltransferase
MESADSVFSDGAFKSSEEVYTLRVADQWKRITNLIDANLAADHFTTDFTLLPEVVRQLEEQFVVEGQLLTWRPVQLNGKRFVSAQEMHTQSQLMGARIVESGFRPTHIVALWRGGCLFALPIHEYLMKCGLNVDHISIRTSLYEAPDKPGKEVLVHGEQYLVDVLQPEHRVLFVDDILESGRSLAAVFAILRKKLGPKCPPPENFKVATLFIKSGKHVEGNPKADFYQEDVSNETWVNFPHELEGLKEEELQKVLSPQVFDILERQMELFQAGYYHC